MSTRKLCKEERQKLKSLFKTTPRPVNINVREVTPQDIKPILVTEVVRNSKDKSTYIEDMQQYVKQYKARREEHQRTMESMEAAHRAELDNIHTSTLEIARLTANLKENVKFVADSSVKVGAKLNQESISNSLIIPHERHASAVAFINSLVEVSNNLVNAMEKSSHLPDPVKNCKSLTNKVTELAQTVTAQEEMLKKIQTQDDDDILMNKAITFSVQLI